MSEILKNISKLFMQKEIIFCFRGPISQELLESLGSNLQTRLQTLEGCNRNTLMKIFSVFVELMQNVIRYSEETVLIHEIGINEMRTGIITISHQEKHFELLCANLILKEHETNLKTILDEIITLTPVEVMEMYRVRRKQNRKVGAKGAGLGFLEIAQHSSSFEYFFTPFDEKFSIFYLNASIK
ncbi:MAG: SiaB family protein kinase [Magnetococcus sp. YQC-5]